MNGSFTHFQDMQHKRRPTTQSNALQLMTMRSDSLWTIITNSMNWFFLCVKNLTKKEGILEACRILEIFEILSALCIFCLNFFSILISFTAKSRLLFNKKLKYFCSGGANKPLIFITFICISVLTLLWAGFWPILGVFLSLCSILFFRLWLMLFAGWP